MNHDPRPRPQGAGACRGDVERDYIHLQLECGVVETIELMSLWMLIIAVSAELDALLLGNVAVNSVSIQIIARLIVADAEKDAPAGSAAFMGCVDMLYHFLHGNSLIHLFLILLFHFLIDHQSHGRLTIPGKIRLLLQVKILINLSLSNMFSY
ncbi:hypothetical protein H0E87_020732 [Populus deltoides]|uniref:Uncharacterized protein n=1 Tax=Populus deltoides TaxID=3696 RepID=A0A8T2XKK3_POPDE|nr:hypothetical protein H0E87_020732 [Populus deltoides]